MKPSRFNPLRIPDRIRFINLHGVPYYIEWEKLLPGYSFFLKTSAHLQAIHPQLRRVEKHFNVKLRACPRCEFGCYGIRVWRLA